MQYADLTTIELIKDPAHWQRQHQKAVELKAKFKEKIAQVRTSQQKTQKPKSNIVCMDGGLRQQALQMAVRASGRGVTL